METNITWTACSAATLTFLSKNLNISLERENKTFIMLFGENVNLKKTLAILCSANGLLTHSLAPSHTWNALTGRRITITESATQTRKSTRTRPCARQRQRHGRTTGSHNYYLYLLGINCGNSFFVLYYNASKRNNNCKSTTSFFHVSCLLSLHLSKYLFVFIPRLIFYLFLDWTSPLPGDFDWLRGSASVQRQGCGGRADDAQKVHTPTLWYCFWIIEMGSYLHSISQSNFVRQRWRTCASC